MIGLLRFEVKIQSNASEKTVYEFLLHKIMKRMAQLCWCIRHCCEVQIQCDCSELLVVGSLK